MEVLKHCIKMEGREVPSNKDVTSLGMDQLFIKQMTPSSTIVHWNGPVSNTSENFGMDQFLTKMLQISHIILVRLGCQLSRNGPDMEQIRRRIPGEQIRGRMPGYFAVV